MVVQGTASAAATSVAIPAHQAGDLILVFARGTAAAPVIPAASGTVPAWVSRQSAIANAVGLTTASHVATASDTTTGTWTSATHIAVLVLRPGAGNVLVVGASSTTNSNNTQTIVYPALTLQDVDGSSWVVRCGTRGVAITAVGTPPTGYTNQIIQPAGAAALMSVHTRAGVTSNPTADSVTTTSSNSAYRAHSVEILELTPQALTLDVNDSVSASDSPGLGDNIGAADSVVATDAPTLNMGFGIAAADSVTVSDLADVQIQDHGPCSAIVGLFTVGELEVGTQGMCFVKPRLRLRGKSFSIVTEGAGTTYVQFSKARMTLTTDAGVYALALGGTVSFTKARLHLRGRPLTLPISVSVGLGKAQLRLRGKSYGFQMSQAFQLGKPRLRLAARPLKRVGQAGLIPTVPETIVLTPSPVEMGLLVPTTVEEPELLTPTPVRVV